MAQCFEHLNLKSSDTSKHINLTFLFSNKMLLKYNLKITIAKHIPRICDLSRVPKSWRYKLPSEAQREACIAAAPVYCSNDTPWPLRYLS